MEILPTSFRYCLHSGCKGSLGKSQPNAYPSAAPWERVFVILLPSVGVVCVSFRRCLLHPSGGPFLCDSISIELNFLRADANKYEKSLLYVLNECLIKLINRNVLKYNSMDKKSELRKCVLGSKEYLQNSKH